MNYLIIVIKQKYIRLYWIIFDNYFNLFITPLIFRWLPTATVKTIKHIETSNYTLLRHPLDALTISVALIEKVQLMFYFAKSSRGSDSARRPYV